MIEEINTKKAELLELVYSAISALEDEIQNTEDYLASLQEKMNKLEKLSYSLA